MIERRRRVQYHQHGRRSNTRIILQVNTVASKGGEKKALLLTIYGEESAFQHHRLYAACGSIYVYNEATRMLPASTILVQKRHQRIHISTDTCVSYIFGYILLLFSTSTPSIRASCLYMQPGAGSMALLPHPDSRRHIILNTERR